MSIRTEEGWNINDGDLSGKRCFVLDMDGTIYLGSKLFNCTKPFLKALKEHGYTPIFFTNNSSRNAAVYIEKLNRMGIEANENNVFTSGMVTVDYIQRVYGDVGVYVLGTPMLLDEFEKRGVRLDDKDPDVVVAGFDTTLDYAKLTVFCDFLRAGKPFLATHPDMNCPTETGFIPDLGAMCALFEAATGRKPDKILGKPYPETMEYVMRKTGFGKDELCFIGDRLNTDVALGVSNGAAGVLVLSGATAVSDIEGSGITPTVVADNIGELVNLL